MNVRLRCFADAAPLHQPRKVSGVEAIDGAAEIAVVGGNDSAAIGGGGRSVDHVRRAARAAGSGAFCH